MGKQSYEELKDAGFEEVIEIISEPEETPTSPPPRDRKEVSPYVVVDNTKELAQLNRSNELMRKALNEMVTKLSEVNQRPKALDLDIQRTSAGFMDRVRITLEY